MKRKTFLEDNPALRFITEPAERESEPTTEAPTPGKAPKGYKPNPAYIEVKSKRLQLLIQPSVYAKIKALADNSGTSVNEYIHKILEKETKGL